MRKSIWAIFAGFLTVVVLSVVTDYALEVLGVFPPQTNPHAYVTWMLALALLYRSIFAVVGGYVTALLAPQSKMKHVVILGILGIIGGCVGVYVGWDYGNQWYPIALAITAFPLTYVGGKLKAR